MRQGPGIRARGSDAIRRRMRLNGRDERFSFKAYYYEKIALLGRR